MSISVIAQDLVTRVKAIPDFSDRVSFVVGAQNVDPINQDVPRPAAWCIFTGDNRIVGDYKKACPITVRLNFIVKILVDYDGDQTALLNDRLPLLHTVIAAIRGEKPLTGSTWLYEGQVLEGGLTEGRMVWAQTYSIELAV